MKIESRSPSHVAVQCDADGCKNAMSFSGFIGLKNACRKFGWTMGEKPWVAFCDQHRLLGGFTVPPDQAFRVAVSYVDNRDSLRKSFAISLINVLLEAQSFAQSMRDNEGVEYQFDLIPGEHGNVAEMREAVADRVLADGYDAVLWLDSDMVFPPGLMRRMVWQLHCNEDADGVTGLYTYKKPPYMPHVYGRYDEASGMFDILRSFPLKETFWVEGAGFGCLLLRASALARVPKPRFEMRFEGARMVAGEDLSFCAKARTRLVMDPTVSCGHLGEHCIEMADYIRHNGLSTDSDHVKVTDKQLSAIMEAMPHLKSAEPKE